MRSETNRTARRIQGMIIEMPFLKEQLSGLRQEINDLQSMNERLRPKLVRELKPGTRIVAHMFNMGPEWPPDRTLQVDGSRIYFWTLPAR